MLNHNTDYDLFDLAACAAHINDTDQDLATIALAIHHVEEN